MRTIKLSFDQEEALKWVIKVCLKNYDMELGSRRCDDLISLFNQIQNAPDDTIMFMELDVLSEGIEKKGGVNPKPNTPRPAPPQGQKETPPTEEELEEMGLEPCPQCDEVAWDGYICQVCGAKEI